MNLRPSGYEPDELPGCSTPRHWFWPGALARGRFRFAPAPGPGGEESGGAGFPVGFSGLAATYSPASWDAVPSARRRLTAEFGMGSGVSLALGPPDLESARGSRVRAFRSGRGSARTRDWSCPMTLNRGPVGFRSGAGPRSRGSACFRIGSKPVGRLVPVS